MLKRLGVLSLIVLMASCSNYSKNPAIARWQEGNSDFLLKFIAIFSILVFVSTKVLNFFLPPEHKIDFRHGKHLNILIVITFIIFSIVFRIMRVFP